MMELAQVTDHIPPQTTIAKVASAESKIAIHSGTSSVDSKSCPMAKNCDPIQRKNDGTWITQLSRSARGPN